MERVGSRYVWNRYGIGMEYVHCLEEVWKGIESHAKGPEASRARERSKRPQDCLTTLQPVEAPTFWKPREAQSTEYVRNRYGIGMEHVWNRYGMGMEYVWICVPKRQRPHGIQGLEITQGLTQA